MHTNELQQAIDHYCRTSLRAHGAYRHSRQLATRQPHTPVTDAELSEVETQARQYVTAAIEGLAYPIERIMGLHSDIAAELAWWSRMVSVQGGPGAEPSKWADAFFHAARMQDLRAVMAADPVPAPPAAPAPPAPPAVASECADADDAIGRIVDERMRGSVAALANQDRYGKTPYSEKELGYLRAAHRFVATQGLSEGLMAWPFVTGPAGSAPALQVTAIKAPAPDLPAAQVAPPGAGPAIDWLPMAKVLWQIIRAPKRPVDIDVQTGDLFAGA